MNFQSLMIELDWLGHILEALAIAAVVAVLSLPTLERRAAILVGLAFAMGHFHGREKRDFEISAGLAPPHLDAYAFWNWSWDQATDFWPVVVVMGLIGLLVVRRR